MGQRWRERGGGGGAGGGGWPGTAAAEDVAACPRISTCSNPLNTGIAGRPQLPTSERALEGRWEEVHSAPRAAAPTVRAPSTSHPATHSAHRPEGRLHLREANEAIPHSHTTGLGSAVPLKSPQEQRTVGAARAA